MVVPPSGYHEDECATIIDLTSFTDDTTEEWTATACSSDHHTLVWHKSTTPNYSSYEHSTTYSSSVRDKHSFQEEEDDDDEILSDHNRPKVRTGKKNDIQNSEREPKPWPVLRIYTCFEDNCEGSARMASLFDSIAMSANKDPISQSITSAARTTAITDQGQVGCTPPSSMTFGALEFHAYHLPPSDLPLLSFGTLLQSTGHFLQRLEIYYLRLTARYSLQLLPQFVGAFASLKCLEHLTWEPLPSCLWWWDDSDSDSNADNQTAAGRTLIGPAFLSHYKNESFLLHALAQLPTLKQLFLTMDDCNGSFGNETAQQFQMQQQLLQQRQGQATTRVTMKSQLPILPSLMKSLEVLQLSNMRLTANTCRLLALGLQEDKEEEEESGERTSMAMPARPSSSFSKLKHLDLSYSCFVGDAEGCLHLVCAMRSNQSLKSLNLMHCKFKAQPSSLASNDCSPSSSSFLRPSVPTQFLEALLFVLEMYNTTLQDVQINHPSVCQSPSRVTTQLPNNDSSSAQASPPHHHHHKATTNNPSLPNLKHRQPSLFTRLRFLLLLNQSQARTNALSHVLGAPSLWSPCLHKISALSSPTMTYQMVHQNLDSLLVNYHGGGDDDGGSIPKCKRRTRTEKKKKNKSMTAPL